MIITDTEWKVIDIYENISPESKQEFNFSKDVKIPYFWIAKPGFCNFNQITKNTKLSTNYRSSELDFLTID